VLPAIIEFTAIRPMFPFKVLKGEVREVEGMYQVAEFSRVILEPLANQDVIHDRKYQVSESALREEQVERPFPQLCLVAAANLYLFWAEIILKKIGIREGIARIFVGKSLFDLHIIHWGPVLIGWGHCGASGLPILVPFTPDPVSNSEVADCN